MKVLSATAVVLVLAGSAAAQIHVDDNLAFAQPVVSGPIEIGGGFNQRGGTNLYTSTTETGSRANAGQAGFITAGSVADNRRTLFDDVPIPVALLNGMTMVDVCHVAVGIRRLANAPATDVNVYWTTLTTTVTPPDTNLDTPPFLIGTVSLPANGATALTQVVDLGVAGGPALFTVPLNMTLIGAGAFGSFSLGVSLSNTDLNNGWRTANGPSANANAIFWVYDPGHTAQAGDEGAYNFGGGLSSFYAVVDGTPVPAPATVALLGLGGLVTLRRRR